MYYGTGSTSMTSKYCRDQHDSGFGKMFARINFSEISDFIAGWALRALWNSLSFPVIFRLCSSCRTHYWNQSESHLFQLKVLKITGSIT